MKPSTALPFVILSGSEGDVAERRQAGKACGDLPARFRKSARKGRCNAPWILHSDHQIGVDQPIRPTVKGPLKAMPLSGPVERSRLRMVPDCPRKLRAFVSINRTPSFSVTSRPPLSTGSVLPATAAGSI